MSVASLECWVQQGEKYEKLWSRSFKCQAICLYWDPKLERIMIGLDNGEIVGIHVGKENNYFKQEEVFFMKVHDKRVMGLFIHNNLLHSISEDKFFKVTNMD